MPPELQQRIIALNARLQNAQLALGDLAREIEVTVKVAAVRISALEKENAELKGKKNGDGAVK